MNFTIGTNEFCDYKKIHKVHFACGELYLFSDVLRMRDPESCLWGVYDRTDSGRIYLEHMACDLTHIGHWLPLPSEYRYARRASRDELRDFFYLLGCDDTLAQAAR